ncbi:DMT family transporter [Peptoniphilus equinus]|uniref:DMT family transporter n=1 Tax=Peptoniphilus equinus TaxID=3016343 RepID=A0ABY7QVN4_9FIRM|nr:DMT family transporter [Peptoniphilus equinus]WBW50125.1 DMT family transporter [Peptoniphilus equinus]
MSTNRNNQGIVHAVLSAIVFGLMPLATQVFYRWGANSVSSAVYRMLPSVIILFFLLRFYYHIDLKVSREEVAGLALTALGFSMTSVTLYSSYQYISSGMATTIHFAYPIVIFIAMNWLRRYMPKKTDIFYITLVALGIVFIMDMRGDGGMNTQGIAFAVLSAFTYSAYSILLEVKNLKSLHPMKLLFYINAFSVVIILVYSRVINAPIFLGFDGVQWLMPVAYSCIITFGASYLYQSAIMKIGATKTAILSTVEPITSLIVGGVILHEPMVLRQIVGAVLVLTATTKLIIRK